VRCSDLAGVRTQDPLLKREMLYQLSYQILKNNNKSDLAGVRTQDPLLKREMLYQLSYQIFFWYFKAANIRANINISYSYSLNLQLNFKMIF
jgi:hypothetical protein